MKRLSLLIAVVICMALGLSACGSSDSAGAAGGSAGEKAVDEACRASIAGEYQITGQDASYWHLHIGSGDGSTDFSIYDNEAGNPGVEGQMVLLDDSRIGIQIDEDYFDALPSDKWQNDGDYLEMTYESDGNTITLTNGGASLVFEKEAGSE